MPSPEIPPGLHPLLAAGVAARRSQPRYQDVGIVEARALNRRRNQSGATPVELFAVDALEIAGPGGPLPLRLYRPSAERALPLLVYLHGGGFVAGDLDTHDAILRRLAREAGILILSVDYRLAPEHPFPAAVHDAEAAIAYALGAADALGANARAVMVGGDSAGGALAAAAAAGIPGLAGLVLLYPVTDLSRIGESESYRLFGDGRAGLSTDDMLWNSALYAPHPASRNDWRCSPLLLPAGTRPPPTLVLTAEFDVLRSDGEAFADLLRARGAAVACHRVTGVNHGFLAAPDAVPQVGIAFAIIADWIVSSVKAKGSRRLA